MHTVWILDLTFLRLSPAISVVRSSLEMVASECEVCTENKAPVNPLVDRDYGDTLCDIYIYVCDISP